MSATQMFSRRMPRPVSRSRQASAAAPAPEHTSFTSPGSLPTTRRPFSTAAPTMIAVPCWSSWNTGIFIRSRHIFSMKKHSGALMSSRLMPPNVGSSATIMSTSFCGSRSLISMSKQSMPANFLNSTALPSITGLAASGPIAPRPSTAVPLVTTPIRLPRDVRFDTSAGSRTISSQAAATPGEYASARSRWLVSCLVGVTEILPGGCWR